MKIILTLKKVALLAIIPFALVNCSEDVPEIKNSTRFNLIASVDNLLMVGSVDFKKLMAESDFENSPNFLMEYNMMYKMVVRDMIDSDLLGVKMEGNNHFAIGMKEGDTDPLIVFTAPIINPDKVKAGVKDFFKGNYTAPTKEDVYHYISEDNAVLAWDDKDIIVVAKDKGSDDLKKEAKRLLDARFVDAPANETLAKFLERTDDMNFYLNSGLSLKIAEKENKEELKLPEDFKKAFEDSYYLAYGNFENGSILFNYEYIAPNFKSSPYNFLGDKPASAEFLNFLSADNKLIGFFAASINLGVLIETVKKTNPDAEFEISNIEKEIGAAPGSLQKLFTGEMAVSFVDMTIPANDMDATDVDATEMDDFDMDYYAPEPKPEVIFTVGINDMNAINSMLTTSKLINNGSYYSMEEAFLVIVSNKLVVTTNEDVAIKLASGASLPAYELPSGVEMKSPMFGFLNTNTARIPNGLMATASTEEGQAALEFLDLFESITMEGTIEKAEVKITMKNKGENALKVITDYILKLASSNQAI
jgi:hypothetical protein